MKRKRKNYIITAAARRDECRIYTKKFLDKEWNSKITAKEDAIKIYDFLMDRVPSSTLDYLILMLVSKGYSNSILNRMNGEFKELLIKMRRIYGIDQILGEYGHKIK